MSLLNILKPISDHGNEMTAKFIHYFGLASAGGGITTGVVNETYTSKLFSPSLWSITDFAAIVGALASVALIIQIVVNLYFGIKEKILTIKRMERDSKAEYDEKIIQAADKLINEIAKRQ